MKMGLDYEQIHYCPDGHILYEGESSNLRHYPKCQHLRYIPISNNILVKVLRYFSIIPRLQRMYRCSEVAKLLKWHAENHLLDRKMRSVDDSLQWIAVREIDPIFSIEDRNCYLEMVVDGVNPYGN